MDKHTLIGLILEALGGATPADIEEGDLGDVSSFYLSDRDTIVFCLDDGKRLEMGLTELPDSEEGA